MQNSLSPGFCKLYYTAATREHVMTIPVIPYGTVTPGEEPQLTANDGTGIDLSDAMTNMANALKVRFPTDASFNHAEYWDMPTPTSNPVWIYDVTLGIAGTATGSSTAGLQQVFTFRTDAGGLWRLYLMEPTGSPNVENLPPFSGNNATLINALYGVGYVVRGRDGGKLITCIRALTKTNDALRKKILVNE